MVFENLYFVLITPKRMRWINIREFYETLEKQGVSMYACFY